MASETTTRQISWDGVPVTVIENYDYLQYGIELPPAPPLLLYLTRSGAGHKIKEGEPAEVVDRLLTQARRSRLAGINANYLAISERRVEIGFVHRSFSKIPPIGDAVGLLRDLAEGIAVAFAEQEETALSQVGAAYRADVDSAVARNQAVILRNRVQTALETRDRRLNQLVRLLTVAPFGVIAAILALSHC